MLGVIFCYCWVCCDSGASIGEEATQHLNSVQRKLSNHIDALAGQYASTMQHAIEDSVNKLAANLNQHKGNASVVSSRVALLENIGSFRFFYLI